MYIFLILLALHQTGKQAVAPLAGPGLGALLRPFTVRCVLLRDHKTPGIPWAWRGRGAEGFGAHLHVLLPSACGKGRCSLCGPAKIQVLRKGVCSGSPEGRADLPRDISALQTLDMSISEAPSAQSCVHTNTSAHCTSVTQDSRPEAKVTLFSLHLPENKLTVCPEVGRAKAACSDRNKCCRQAGTDAVRPRQQDAEMPARRLHLLQQVKPSQLLKRTKKKKQLPEHCSELLILLYKRESIISCWTTSSAVE